MIDELYAMRTVIKQIEKKTKESQSPILERCVADIKKLVGIIEKEYNSWRLK